jgi:adenosylhomocysteine nucleosidase
MTEITTPVFVCFALPEEARPFQKRVPKSPAIRVIVTGMGSRNTERSLAAALGESKPAFVLTCGLAGGLDAALPPSTVLFETGDAALAARLSSAGLRAARFHCAGRIVVTAFEKAALRRETGADAVEMESGCIHAICRRHGVRCATVRVISDTASEDLPLDFNALATPEMNMDFGKLALAVARSPGRIPSLLRLQRRVSMAANALAEKLVAILDGRP